MIEKGLAAVILAAGQGTRMKSALPKVLHPVAGQPMLGHVLRVAQAVGASPVVPVVGHGAEQVRAIFEAEEITFALQSEQLGTGHALLCAESVLGDFSGDLLLLCGDVPLLQESTLQRLIAHHRSHGAVVTILTAMMGDPTGYGRIIRGESGVERIVEEKDATREEKEVAEINTGIYLFEAPQVFELLRSVGNRNAQGEYYLTDVVAAACSAGKRVEVLSVEDNREAMGINDRRQLALANAVLFERINDCHMLEGVTLVDPTAVYIDHDVVIGSDTLLHPGVHLRGRTRIGRDCVIEPGVVATDCQIGDRVHLKAGSVLTESIIGDECTIGPMAHLRSGTVLDGQNKLGNFVETKKALIGRKSQASHLTYIGDATLGQNVNVGCGTITCNYDGVNKHQTIIEDDVFVGSDSQLVAPVRIGHGSLIGAGSTITKDVPPDSLALSRSEQRIIEGWAARKREKQKKK
ncbi:MAG: bifunctional UDP-N-acetylglucosamine diphosphorylase/glucosamine-1-phosphate N-acetyltransferase GlmU [Desulfuromonadales bacterium]|nr:bifunctional UDP-N-acetylglucosamine diphosphorylase/glucosamine-1-phosphate N-acetyltransferase GlmU [Desulfuromonadales bacterium]